jgi:hypothetical protein
LSWSKEIPTQKSANREEKDEENLHIKFTLCVVCEKGERERTGWALVAHDCNPSYSGGRDQEDCCLKPVQANSWQDYLEKNPSQKRAGGVA